MPGLELPTGIASLLEDTYHDNVTKIVNALSAMGPRYYFRVNTLRTEPSRLIENMREQGFDARLDERIPEAAFVPTRLSELVPRGVMVEANRFAAEAVLQGSHLYAPGVRNCHGLKPGSDATVTDEACQTVGVGIARQSETRIRSYRQGVAVEVIASRYGLPSLMDRTWYEEGKIQLQSFPAMVTTLVLDPKPGETIVDMNCAPGGKLSHMCQITGNFARLIGFDRNATKLEKTNKQLQRLGCANYELKSHDSRYVHTDFSFNADRVLVDPPCTGLGVTPKLAIETTKSDVVNLSSYQRQFLAAAAGVVKTGGTIVYSVCTITQQECEDVARFGVEKLGLKLESATPMLGRPGEDPEGLTQRFDPDVDGSGYFIAKFTKN